MTVHNFNRKPLDALARKEVEITRADSLKGHRLECLEIARAKWNQARRVGASEYTRDMLAEWVARLAT